MLARQDGETEAASFDCSADVREPRAKKGITMAEPSKIVRRRFLGGAAAGVAGAMAWSSTSGDAAAEASEAGQAGSGSRLKDRERSIEEMVYSARLLREMIQSCPHRPRYHLMAPEAGPTNDVNGLIYWKGRYHFCILGRMPICDRNDPNNDDWRGRVWFHASSHDMVHWIHHPPVLKADEHDTASHYVGPQSGTNIINSPKPALIYLYGSRYGTAIATADDPEDPYLIDWTPLPQNPVIPWGVHPEVMVHDPCAWYQDGTYYALVGGKNYRKGYEGDCTSLFRSTNLVDWEYRGPFYQSRREWTHESTDAACPCFFPMDDRHMLLMHGHQPYTHVHYYLGRFNLEEERFDPEEHGRFTWPGGHFAGPEAFQDGQGRWIMAGWIPEDTGGQGRWLQRGYASCISLPRVLSLGSDGSLCITPIAELEALRVNHRKLPAMPLADGEVTAEGVAGECLELAATIQPNDAQQVGVKVRCAPDSGEQTQVVYDRKGRTLTIHETRLDGENRHTNQQQAPLPLGVDEPPATLRAAIRDLMSDFGSSIRRERNFSGDWTRSSSRWRRDRTRRVRRSSNCNARRCSPAR
jgi:beta-fructofuranosidase